MEQCNTLHCDSVRLHGRVSTATRGKSKTAPDDVWSVGDFDVQLGAVLLLHAPEAQGHDVVLYRASGSEVDGGAVAAGSQAYGEHAAAQGIARATLSLEQGDMYLFKAVRSPAMLCGCAILATGST